MKILVTGGAGFIGSHLVERLLGGGHEVHVLDSFHDYYDPQIKWANLVAFREDPRLRIIEGDILDAERVDRLFDEYHYEKVAHLAARAGVRPSIEDPLAYEEVNCRGTLHLLQASVRTGVERFVFASSSSVYGNNEKVPFSEEDRVDRPISPYAATKLAGELLCHTAHHLHGLSIACLRFFTVYGPRQRPDMAIHKFTRLIDQEEEVPVFGDGSSSRDYTYYEDCVDGVVAALEADLGFEIINLGDHRQVPLSLLLELIEQSIGKRAHRVYLPMQPGDVRTTYADITKAGSLLGYEPRFPIEQGIEIFVDWYRKHVDILVG